MICGNQVKNAKDVERVLRKKSSRIDYFSGQFSMVHGCIKVFLR